MAERLMGIETEYGIVPASVNRGPKQDALDRALVAQATSLVPSIADGGRGLFAQNGSRFYIDAGHHPEWTTPEVANPWDAVRYVLAGERLLSGVAASIPSLLGGDAPIVLKTNTDYTTHASWGCHESVLHRSAAAVLASNLIPFLVSRTVFAGAGGFTCAPGLEFVISPRALHLPSAVSRESTWHRGIFHTKDEALCGHGYKRLHVLCGESLNSEIAMWLRSGTLAVVVAMVDGGLTPGVDVELGDPVRALRALVYDPTCRLELDLQNGRTATACDIQRHYLALAEAHAEAKFMPPWAAAVCREWRSMLDRIAGAPDAVSGVLDWAIKLSVFTRHLARRGFDWPEVAAWSAALFQLFATLDGDAVLEADALFDPPASAAAHRDRLEPLLGASGLTWDRLDAFARVRREVFELDARFSQLGGESIFALLDRDGVLAHHVPGVDNIEHAMVHPPAIGRAGVRGAVIRRVQPHRDRFLAGWGFIVDQSSGYKLDLSHPFEREERWDPVGVSHGQGRHGEIDLFDPGGHGEPRLPDQR